MSSKLFFYSRMLLNTTLTEIRAKYSGTFLGMIWVVLYPVLFLGLYSVVYIMIFQVKVGHLTTVEYVLLIFSGLIPFLGFSEALSAGVVSIQSNKALIKNTFFPLELIPIRTVLSSSSTMLVGVIILQLLLWFRGVVHPSQMLLPVILIIQLIFTVGFVWMLAALQVFIRDLGQSVSIFILFLMFASPIAYTVDMVPSSLMPLMYCNPLYYLIMLYRGSMVEGAVSVPCLVTFTGISLLMLWLGYYVFSRLKSVFSDYI